MQERRALVTGASSGIGRELALQLARRGYTVTAVARREERLRELVAALEGNQHEYVTADLSREEGVAAVAANLQAILAANCGAVLALAHHFLKQSEAGDALIDLSSIVSVLPTPAQPVYSASKAFFASFSPCLWEEHRHRGVDVMGLCPGITQTEFIHAATVERRTGSPCTRPLSRPRGRWSRKPCAHSTCVTNRSWPRAGSTRSWWPRCRG